MKVISKSWLGGLCLLAVSIVMAADGAIEIWEPTTISQSGHYILTRDITSSGLSTIEIADTDDVQIDLNGFVVENTNGSGNAIYVWSSDRPGIINGNLKGGKIYLDQCNEAVVEGLRITGAGILVEDSSGISLRRNVVKDSPGIGIECSACSDGEITGNRVIGTGTSGIYISGASLGGKLIGNMVSGAGQSELTHAIWITATAESWLILDNVSRNNLGNGITIYGPLMHIERNLVSQNAGYYGLSSWNMSHRIAHNVVSNNDGFGLNVSHDYCQVEHNLIIGNDFGLRLQGNHNIYRGNTSRNNGGDFQDAGTGNTSHGDNYLPTQM